jgi:hypothetical protein
MRRSRKERSRSLLAGNCISCLGVVWFDAHADFDTPDDNLSGFLDVMGLAILTGSGWRALRETIPGFVPVDEENVVLAGVRDLDPYQRVRLERSHIRTVPGPRWREGDFEAALEELHGRVDRVYLHIDLDALDLTEGTANEYAAPGGLTLDQLLAAVRAVFARRCGIRHPRLLLLSPVVAAQWAVTYTGRYQPPEPNDRRSRFHAKSKGSRQARYCGACRPRM